MKSYWLIICKGGLPQWLSGKESTCNAGDAGDTGSIPGSGKPPGGGHGNPLQPLPWRVPWPEGPGGLQFTLSQSDTADGTDAGVAFPTSSSLLPSFLRLCPPVLSPSLIFLFSPCYCCSVAKPHPTLCNPMDCSPPGSSALRCLPEFAQTPVQWAGGAIQPSRPSGVLLLCPQSFLQGLF